MFTFQCIANSVLQAKMNTHLFGAAQTAVGISRATSVEFETQINILKHSYWKVLLFTHCLT